MIAVAGGKGGCGKTTTTLGLARALPGTVRAIEGDWDLPNLHALAGTPREPPRTPRDASNRTAAVGHRVDGDVRVVPPPIDPADADPYCHLDRLREPRGESIAATLVDCPSGAGPDAAAPLSVADRTLLVTTLSPPALRDTAKTAAMARELDARPIGVVVTRTEPVPDGVAAFLSTPVLGTVPAVRPPVVSDPRVRTAYRDVAAALRRSTGGDGTAAGPAGERTPASKNGRRTPKAGNGRKTLRAGSGRKAAETNRPTPDGRTADVDPANWSYPR
ncbi:nucleotide-binding protein [Halopenitus persicus]|uniref:nucleotide-binding protein n=1 Tax=Halopenitus persicus TaxID=1048396 RepID=UPI000BBB2214|nr:hypothetical protein [Halopenitus persicus]